MPVIHEPDHLKNERQLQKVSDQLSSLVLPEPSIITKLQIDQQDQKRIGDRDVRLSTMNMGDPEGQSTFLCFAFSIQNLIHGYFFFLDLSSSLNLS